jgi:hypothetical protein
MAPAHPGKLPVQMLVRYLFAGVSLSWTFLGCRLAGEGEESPDQTWPPLAQNQLDTQRPLVTESVKRTVVSIARDSWEVYFSRLFPATVRAPCLPLPASLEHSGLRLEGPHLLLILIPG